MRLNLTLLASLVCSTFAASIADAESKQSSRAPAVADAVEDIAEVYDEPDYDPLEDELFEEDEDDEDEDVDPELWKRRGGGGGGGGRGGGGGGRGGGSSSSGGGRGGPTTPNGKGTNTFSNSNRGGYSNGGTGPQPGFAGGRYGGGSKVPFAAGGRSPSGMSPRSAAPFVGAGLAFFPAFALFGAGGAYLYGPYGYSHRYYNRSSSKDEEREIICACAPKAECMCDDIDDEEFWDDLIGDGEYDKLNKSVVDVAKVNGTTMLTVNGTLPNGTTVHSSDEDDYREFLLNAATQAGKMLGFWPAVAVVAATIYLV